MGLCGPFSSFWRGAPGSSFFFGRRRLLCVHYAKALARAGRTHRHGKESVKNARDTTTRQIFLALRRPRTRLTKCPKKAHSYPLCFSAAALFWREKKKETSKYKKKETDNSKRQRGLTKPRAKARLFGVEIQPAVGNHGQGRCRRAVVCHKGIGAAWRQRHLWYDADTVN